jgi:DNA-binding NarL/FixJ family response regulator
LGKSCSTILIAEDHTLVRFAFASSIDHEPHLKVVAQAENGQEAIRLASEHNPDLILMDIRMPKMDGLEATERIKAFAPHIPILILTTFESSDCILKAIRAGAAGYMIKDITREELIQTIDNTLAGEVTMQAQMTKQLLHYLAQEKENGHIPGHIPYESRITAFHASTPSGTRQAPQSLLTNQEHQTLELLAKGLTNAQIAGKLHLSRHTIKSYVERIIAKLEVSDRTQAAVRAVSLGLVADPINS